MADEEKIEDEDTAEAAEGAEGAENAAAAKEKPAAPSRFGGTLGTILGIGLVTILAGGLGAGLGLQTASAVAQSIAERAKAHPPADQTKSAVFTGDMVLQPLEAVITNLASPADVWIRLETAIVFSKDQVKSPLVTAAEIRQDIVAYVRTVNLAQLEGPSALQHLREDLNERVAVRTNGAVKELVIQSLIVQ
jgi:flagellar FliL protein